MDLLSSPDMQSQLLETALRKYYKYKGAEYVGDAILNRFDGTAARQKLEDKERMLNIMAKQRALGLPMEDDDYERATNQDKPFYSQLMRTGTKRALQAIPSPGLLNEKHTPFFKIAESVASELPSFRKIPSKGAKYAGSIGRAAAALFAL